MVGFGSMTLGARDTIASLYPSATPLIVNVTVMITALISLSVTDRLAEASLVGILLSSIKTPENPVPS